MLKGGTSSVKYIFLKEDFYNVYNSTDFPEIERKSDRPYIMIQINIYGVDFAIPLRSGISHKHVLWTDKANKCGVDYSKAIIITDSKYIDSKKPYIRPNEHKALMGKEYILKSGFEKYIENYKKALTEMHIERNEKLCKFSTLQYYHKELGI